MNKEYKILSWPEEDILSDEVNKHLASGWKLHGGVSCSLSEGDEYRYKLYAQAMVRPLSKSSGGPINHLIITGTGQQQGEETEDSDSGSDYVALPYIDDDDEMESFGCCFSGQCLMPDRHFRSECHTIEMYEVANDG